MSKLILILPVMLFLASCGSVSDSETGELTRQTQISCEDNEWLLSLIEEFKDSESKGEIIQYTYNGEVVYFVNGCLECYDWITVVYSCTGEERCKFGGIAGFNTCRDFFEKATDKQVIWKN